MTFSNRFAVLSLDDEGNDAGNEPAGVVAMAPRKRQKVTFHEMMGGGKQRESAGWAASGALDALFVKHSHVRHDESLSTVAKFATAMANCDFQRVGP